MPTLALPLVLTDAQHQALLDELAQFVRIATALNPEFVAPSLADFALAKLSGDTGLLTQESIRQAVLRVPQTIIQRSGEEHTFYALASALRSARLYNFAWVCAANNEAASETKECAQQFAKRIADELHIDERHVPALANALAEAAVPVDTAARVYFPCQPYKLVDAISEREDSAYKAIFEGQESDLYEVIQWKVLSGLAVEAGLFSEKESAERFAFIKKLRPALFEREPDDWIDKIAATLKKVCGHKARSQETA